jgi:hypothetical protein
MENFKNKLDTKLNELETTWNDIKKLNEFAKHTKVNLFLDIEATIKKELMEANEDKIISYKKQFADFIKDYSLTLDAKKDIKKLDILALIDFKVQKSIPLMTRINKNGKTMYMPLTRLSDIKKLKISNSQIKKATSLYSENSENKEYLKMINKIIDDAKNAIFEDEKKTAIEAGIENLKINSVEDMEKIVNYMTKSLKLKKK